MHTDEVLRICVNAGLFPQLVSPPATAFHWLQVAGRLVPQRFTVNGFFDDKEFTLAWTTQATVT
jgi:hypothetical protein